MIFSPQRKADHTCQAGECLPLWLMILRVMCMCMEGSWGGMWEEGGVFPRVSGTKMQIGSNRIPIRQVGYNKIVSPQVKF